MKIMGLCGSGSVSHFRIPQSLGNEQGPIILIDPHLGPELEHLDSASELDRPDSDAKGAPDR